MNMTGIVAYLFFSSIDFPETMPQHLRTITLVILSYPKESYDHHH
jgi:hypothetical protein